MTAGRVQIAASILASDFLHLGDAVSAAERGGADRLHIDVMDGRFVPNISIGQPIVQAIRPATEMLLETHLMIVEPERYVGDFARAGADLITIHVEVSPHLYRTVQQIQGLGKRAGVALNPATHWTAVEEVLGLADLILVMTVSPGFGGQEFIDAMCHKVERIRDAIDRRGVQTEVEVDGGIEPETARRAAGAGARVLVAGTAVYRAEDGVADAIAALRVAAEGSQ